MNGYNNHHSANKLNSTLSRVRKFPQLKLQIAVNGTPMTELWDVTCHMGSHSVICYPTQVNVPHANPSPQAVTRFTYPGGIEG